jgi:hypothetical protein
MAISYKQKCSRCKTNWVEVTSRSRHRICTACESTQLKGEIKDPAMKKLFAIPEEYYNNPFLRDIKVRYLMFGSLSEKQVSTFKDVVEKIRKNKEGGASQGTGSGSKVANKGTGANPGMNRKTKKEQRPVIE